jgi:hypothetical protein
VEEVDNYPAMHGMQTPLPQANVDATGKNEIQIVNENFTFRPRESSRRAQRLPDQQGRGPHTVFSTSPDKNSIQAGRYG